MNEITELKGDVAFLKKFDSRINAWIDKGKRKDAIKKRVKSNFLLHPRKLHSDSECSVLTSPERFSSTTVIKRLSLQETNNNFAKNVSCNMSCIESSVITYDDTECLDRHTEKVKSKTVCKTKPSIVDSSNPISSLPKKCRKVRPMSSLARFENVDKKFSILAEKSLKILNNIRQTLENGISPADGEEDLNRRLKRLQEFSSRFSRNYLYPLLRQMEELNSSDGLGTVSINQKLIYTQQAICNALQAYYSYLPSSVDRCCSDKLKTLLEQILSLCDLYDVLKEGKTESKEVVKILRAQTEVLVETVDTFNLKIAEKNRKATELEKELVKNKSKGQNDRKKSKLSMYANSASFRKDTEWKKAVESLAKKKFNVKSRYKTSLFKHRPPVEKPHIVQLPSKVQLYHKRSSTTLKSTPIRSPLREDEIQTMVEAEDEIRAPPNTGEVLNHGNSVKSSGRLAPDSDPEIEEALEKEEEEVEDGKLKRALDVLKKFLGQDRAQFLEKIADAVDTRKKEDSEKKEHKKKLPPVVTVTGAKNAKLICIRDDNSVVEEEVKKDKQIMTDVEVKQTSSETQTDLQPKQFKSRSTIKISRLPKCNRKVLKLLPKEYAIDIIQYKLRYAHFHKQNPMYRKSANVQPWILMGRISDDILDYVLRSVTSELEVIEILENLYQAEFQY